MATPKKKYLVGNWKMAPSSIAEAKKLMVATRKKAREYKKVTTIVCPPFPFIQVLNSYITSPLIALGAQDCFHEADGAYTGATSVGMIKSVGTRYVIIGHSNRRDLGDTNEMVAQKVFHARSEGLIPIICVGEKVRDPEGVYLQHLDVQVKTAISKIQKTDVKKVIFAYEPVWAIGAKSAMEPNDVHEAVILIRRSLSKVTSKEIADTVPLLYGGAVGPENTVELMKKGQVQGFLVGRASLDPHAFGLISEYVNNS